MTPQDLACNARQIARWANGDRSILMGALVALVAQWTGQTMTCASLQAAAAQFNCLPANAQLPALIYLMSQVVAGGPLLQGIGSPVGVVTPGTAITLYIDNTNPNQQGVWVWSNNAWNNIIAP